MYVKTLALLSATLVNAVPINEAVASFDDSENNIDSSTFAADPEITRIQCNGHDEVKITFKYSDNLGSFVTGQSSDAWFCSNNNLNPDNRITVQSFPATADTDKYFEVSYNPYNCQSLNKDSNNPNYVQPNYNSLSSWNVRASGDSALKFYRHVEIDGVVTTTTKYSMEAECTFRDTYETSTTIKDVTLETVKELGQTDMTDTSETFNFQMAFKNDRSFTTELMPEYDSDCTQKDDGYYYRNIDTDEESRCEAKFIYEIESTMRAQIDGFYYPSGDSTQAQQPFDSQYFVWAPLECRVTYRDDAVICDKTNPNTMFYRWWSVNGDAGEDEPLSAAELDVCINGFVDENGVDTVTSPKPIPLFGLEKFENDQRNYPVCGMDMLSVQAWAPKDENDSSNDHTRWRITYKLFMMTQDFSITGSYNLECDIVVCHRRNYDTRCQRIYDACRGPNNDESLPYPGAI